MKFLPTFLFLCSLFSSSYAMAADSENAKAWLERLSQSLRQLNFSTSFVVVKNNQAEPYHWLHGVDENNLELEILARLNGPRRDILRKGDTVSYIEPEQEVYSVNASSLSGPIPAIFSADITELEANYRFISVGRSRVLGRAAQLIRVVPKDNHRFGYWLWLDQHSAMLLKLAITSRKGKLLEQVQFTHLDITDSISDNLLQLQATELPKELPIKNHEANLMWQTSWLPEGFTAVKADRHRMYSNKKAVEFMHFSDGLVDISVYVNPSEDKQRPLEYAHDGATIVLNQVNNSIEVSVVGKIPLNTAKQIANGLVSAVPVSSDIEQKP